jgi:hypothetical protein
MSHPKDVSCRGDIDPHNKCVISWKSNFENHHTSESIK